MNEPERQPDTPDGLSPDWPDRLIDQALREKLAGETPPDLTERVLAAADDPAYLSSIRTDAMASEDQAANDNLAETPRQGFTWRALAMAASVAFLAGGLLATEVARQANEASLAHADSADPPVARLTEDGSVVVDPKAPVTDLLTESELAAIPTANEPPITYPDRETWEELTSRRKKYNVAEANAPAQAGGGQSAPEASAARVVVIEGREYTLEESTRSAVTSSTAPEPAPKATTGFAGVRDEGLKRARPEPPRRDRADGRGSRFMMGFGTNGDAGATSPAQSAPAYPYYNQGDVTRYMFYDAPAQQGNGLASLADGDGDGLSRGETTHWGYAGRAQDWYGALSDDFVSTAGLAIHDRRTEDLEGARVFDDLGDLALGESLAWDAGLGLGADELQLLQRVAGEALTKLPEGQDSKARYRLRFDADKARGLVANEKQKIDELTTQLKEHYAKASTPADDTPAADPAQANAGEAETVAAEGERVARRFKELLAVRGEIAVRHERIEWLERRIEQAEGQGPGQGGDQYTAIHENPFVEALGERAVSTFSIDVDTASYANVRQFLNSGQLPPADAVRLEELINYFDYGYEGPSEGSVVVGDAAPFAADVEVAGCPWTPEHRLVRIGVKGYEVAERPLTNLVFLLDVSGSMNNPDKHPLVIEGLKSLVKQLGENDRVAIVVYASKEGLALPATAGDDHETILGALDSLRAGGSTAGGAGIQLAYQIAEDNFIEGGCNRVILCTDGDFNVGTTSTAELERLVAEKAKQTGVFLSVCGFGRGNLNDTMMETISGKGNGEYYYVDSLREAEKVFVKGLTGTLVTIAKDVKIQVEFNPAQVAGYRLLGYENRMLRTQDFNDDKKDAGEIGAGHTVTALYEIVPAGEEVPAPAVDELKYQRTAGLKANAAETGETLTLKMRYKKPDEDASTKLEWAVKDAGLAFGKASTDLQFASAVASFGMQLRNSKHAGDASFDAVLEIAGAAQGDDAEGYRAEFLELVKKAKQLRGE